MSKLQTPKRVKGYVLAILRRARGERPISSESISDVVYVTDASSPIRQQSGNRPSRQSPSF